MRANLEAKLHDKVVEILWNNGLPCEFYAVKQTLSIGFDGHQRPALTERERLPYASMITLYRDGQLDEMLVDHYGKQLKLYTLKHAEPQTTSQTVETFKFNECWREFYNVVLTSTGRRLSVTDALDYIDTGRAILVGQDDGKPVQGIYEMSPASSEVLKKHYQVLKNQLWREENTHYRAGSPFNSEKQMAIAELKQRCFRCRLVLNHSFN